jgi:hypothetical protein
MAKKAKKVKDSERIDAGNQRAFENVSVDAHLEDEDRAMTKYLENKKRAAAKGKLK